MPKKTKRFANTDTQIQITGDHEVLVECCKKIIEYNDIMVKVKTRDMTVTVWGSDLSVNDFCTSGIYIRGRVQSIELMGNG
ncbi:MAG: YabP/YqfC family sporulation protein [Clostridium sp.]|nr:YabP/YqfC family sporulation protein [Clostridium sp.]MCM1547814.1 YabP/YqfC family sporulation protein [Ruminococcus sp.]